MLHWPLDFCRESTPNSPQTNVSKVSFSGIKHYQTNFEALSNSKHIKKHHQMPLEVQATCQWDVVKIPTWPLYVGNPYTLEIRWEPCPKFSFKPEKPVKTYPTHILKRVLHGWSQWFQKIIPNQLDLEKVSTCDQNVIRFHNSRRENS